MQPRHATVAERVSTLLNSKAQPEPRIGKADYDEMWQHVQQLVDAGWSLRTACREVCPPDVGLSKFHMAMYRRMNPDK